MIYIAQTFFAPEVHAKFSSEVPVQEQATGRWYLPCQLAAVEPDSEKFMKLVEEEMRMKCRKTLSGGKS